MPSAVLDSSAILALVFDEPGADAILALGGDVCCSAVNLSEALAKLSDRGIPRSVAEDHLVKIVRQVVPFDEAMARGAAALRAATRFSNISFGDRACLATGIALALPVITADRDWAGLDLGVEVRLIR
jgi:PIN domain nuclease of toxin-antitoxin system